MRIGIPREIHEGERRVATTPEVATLLQKLGFEVAVESQAGQAAKFTDTAYTDAGVAVVESGAKLYEQS
ncbi:MAG: NAD(P)(+) transhydrogenase (Re/Si-specific) subunit alpha, partial [Desulfofustis sp.]|nr:NAD(P)(+) transhydrogenase (Re/Si-specific) subunit alpha [Desulfofustis sp.]